MRLKLISKVSMNLLITSLVLFVASSPGEALFMDDFNDGNSFGWTKHCGDWQVINGEYVYGADGPTDTDGVTTTGNINWESYIFESRFKWLAGDPQIYFLFRFTDYQDYDRYNGYSFGHQPGQWQLIRWRTDGGLDILEEEPYPPLTSEGLYDVKIEAIGNQISAYVKKIDDEYGTPILQVNDSTYPTGSIGFRADVSTIAFDDVRVTVVPEPSTWFILGSGLLGLAFFRIKREKLL